MCNCGSKQPAAPALPVPRPAGHLPAAAATPEPVWFEYTGATALTVQGPFSGRRYRFDAPGAQVAIDARDAASLTAIRTLRRVGKGSNRLPGT